MEYKVSEETLVEKVWITPDAEKLIAEIARVSNPGNQKNPKYAGLLKYLIQHKHWSPLEMASLCVSINTSRRIAPQILRHRSFSFQEFCITGDSLITTIMPNGIANYITIKKLYERQNWKQYKKLSLRVFDEKTKLFTNAKYKEVFYTGKKPVFKITLSDGKFITSTKEHKFYTSGGYKSLESIVGLELTGNNRALMTRKGIIGTNGIPCYQNYEWMKEQRESLPIKSVSEIAKNANISYHTVKKWIKIHNLNYSKLETATYRKIWNKNKFGYKTKLVVSEKHKEAIRKSRSGPNSNWWRGGVERSERLKISDWCQTIRLQKLKESNFSCIECNSHEKLELDHIIPVYENINLAYDYNNIQVLCHECHTKKHNLNNDAIKWRKTHKGNTLSPKWVNIEKIEYVGIEDTYDIEIDHPSHNYVANKIMVHNSTRYAAVDGFVKVNPRRQDFTNRQSSHDDLSVEDKTWFEENKNKLEELAMQFYKEGLDRGFAKETMAFVLPMSAKTHIYMTGTIRSWIHYIDLRADAATQLEHRIIAQEVKKIIIQDLPNIAIAMGWAEEN